MTNPAIEEDESGEHAPAAVWLRVAAAHDRIFSEHNKTALKHLVIRLGIAGFAIHLLLIFLAKTLAHPPTLIAGAGENYLVAISTPFNFILFYEVVTLIGALHESTTRSIAYQFEIVSLIFIREVFKDIAEAAEMVTKHTLTLEALPLFVDMWAGFLMYLLVAVFQHVAQGSAGHMGKVAPSMARARFVAQKKGVALGLGALLLTMAAYNIGLFGMDVFRDAVTGQTGLAHVTTFYNDLFTVMIFTDVLILILSIVVSGHYEFVFRSAAFVVSIVLIRFALTEGYPYGAPLAILAMVFGIMVLIVFNYHMRIHQKAATSS
ncbi:MAG: hypothetical protein ABR976_07210 [Terracidiphilus sp.]|jgi:hypothetical protein